MMLFVLGTSGVNTGVILEMGRFGDGCYPRRSASRNNYDVIIHNRPPVFIGSVD